MTRTLRFLPPALTLAVLLFGSMRALADEKLFGIASRSVHLRYPAPDAAFFYNELTPLQSAPGTYFMACGFSDGYFGIQELANGRKVV